MSDNKLLVVFMVCATLIVVAFTAVHITKSYYAYEVAKVKAAEGHKFKFGITKEDNNEAK